MLFRQWSDVWIIFIVDCAGSILGIKITLLGDYQNGICILLSLVKFLWCTITLHPEPVYASTYEIKYIEIDTSMYIYVYV